MISISRVVRFKELMHSICPGLGLGEVSLSHSPPSSWASAGQWLSPGFMTPCHSLWKLTYWRININVKALLEFALPEKNLHLHSSSPCLCPKSSVRIARVLFYILGIFVEDHDSWETANPSFHEGSMKQIYHNTTNVYLLHFVNHFALQHFSSPVERYFSPTWHFFFFTHTHDTYVISQIRSHKNMKTLPIISLLLSQFCSSMSDHLPCSRISVLTSTWCRNLSWIVRFHLIHYFRKL